MYYGGPYLFEKITSSRYLGGGPNVLEGPICIVVYIMEGPYFFEKIKFRQIYRGVHVSEGVQLLQQNKFQGVHIFRKISSGGNQFWGVHFCHDRAGISKLIWSK